MCLNMPPHLVAKGVAVGKHHELVFQPRILLRDVCQPGLVPPQLCLQAAVPLAQLDVLVPHSPQLAQLDLLGVFCWRPCSLCSRGNVCMHPLCVAMHMFMCVLPPFHIRLLIDVPRTRMHKKSRQTWRRCCWCCRCWLAPLRRLGSGWWAPGGCLTGLLCIGRGGCRGSMARGGCSGRRMGPVYP